MKNRLAIYALLPLILSVVTVCGQQPARANNQKAAAAAERNLTLQTTESVTSLPNRAKRYALIIGIDQYQDEQISVLKGATNDAKALADALVRYAGFPADQVVLLASDQPPNKQPTRANVLSQLSALRGVVPADGMLMISFAGHGMERNNEAYLLPSDAKISDINLLEDTAIAVRQLKERIRATGVDQVMLVLDACRNDPSSGRASADNPLTQAYTRGFNFDLKNREVKAFVTLFATSPGQRAYEFPEKRQGYFTYHLIEALKGKAANENGEVTLGAVIKHLQQEVPKQVRIATGKEQKPFVIVDGYKADDLVLSVTVNVNVAGGEATAKSDNATDLELEFWRSIKESNNTEEFKAYLAKYPQGSFATLARARLDLLEKNTHSVNPEAKRFFDLGREHFRQFRFQPAVQAFERAVEIKPDYAEAYEALATAYFSVGYDSQTHEKAAAALRKALEIKPDYADAYISLSAYYFRTKDDQKAKEVLEKAVAISQREIELNNDNAAAYFSLGQAYSRLSVRDQGIKEKVIEAIKQGLRIKTGSRDDYNTLALTYSLLNRKPEAIETYQQLIRIEPDYYGGYSSLAALLKEANRNEEAIEVYKQYIKNVPEPKYAYRDLGKLYLKTGNRVEARKQYDILKELDARLADELLHEINKR